VRAFTMLFLFIALGGGISSVNSLASHKGISREDLQLLISDKSVSIDDFKEPYLMVQNGWVLKKPMSEIENRFLSTSKEREIKARSHFPFPKSLFPKWTDESLPVAEEWKNKKELEGLEDCKIDKCFPKLNDLKEKPLLLKSKKKLETYHQLVSKRIQAFLEKQQLLGYESRNDNRIVVKELLKLAPFLKLDYSAAQFFLMDKLWEGATGPSSLVGSFLRTQNMVLGTNRLQPVYWAGEVFHFSEKGKSLFVEVVIYSNHYFDSWIRIYEIVDLSEKFKAKTPHTGLLITDLTEIDELKKSALIRSLYKGNMVDAITKAQELELKAFSDF